MQVENKNYDSSIAHPQRSCRLAGIGKEHYSNLLTNSAAHPVYVSEARKLMKQGDPIPSILPTKNALRIIKCRDTTEHGRTTTDVISALVELKFNSTPSVIGDISIHPFFVSYQLPIQKEFYKFATNRKRSVVSIDATGFSMYTSSFLPTNQKHKMPIFLYTVALHWEGKTMAVYQVLSDRHSLSFLRYWLCEWGKENKKPVEIFLDDSAALVGACVQAFAMCPSTNGYISSCMDCLLSGNPPPKVFIRLDRSHFVKSLHRLKILNQADPRKKVFFKRVFGCLILCDNVNTARKIIKDLLVVIKSERVTATCLESLNTLKKICEEGLYEEEE